MKEIKFKNEVIQVVKATGYNDGYYWDMNAEIVFRGEFYKLYDIGSGSGYIPCSEGITKCDFNRLYGAEQSYIDEDEWDFFERCICDLLEKFIKSGATESWEKSYDDGNVDIFIDGEKRR